MGEKVVLACGTGGHPQMMKKFLAIQEIEKYIMKNNYTCIVEKLLKEYRKQKEGWYISFTAKECINEFKEEFELLDS